MNILKKLREASHRMQDGRELAEYVTKVINEELDIQPRLDVFSLCSILKVNLVPSKLKDIDGIYLSENSNKSNKIRRALIALNVHKNNIRRLKFTLAHELCHHIKDYKMDVTPTILGNDKVEIPYSRNEQFANQFASYLLIPEDELKKQLSIIDDDQAIIKNEAICILADYFEMFD